jgi:hypothetical protein
MSKKKNTKKNTLKDLDEFLKQQAASLVTPTPLAAKVETPKKTETVSPEKSPQPHKPSEDAVLEELKGLAVDRKKLYDLIVKSIEAQDKSLPEDTMLINTALYLRSGQNWKEEIRKYWKSR